MDWFWSGFWPNFASTLGGVILGVPIALWLNRLSSRSDEKRREAEETERLRNGLLAVVSALSHNRECLLALSGHLQQNRAPFDVGLDTAAWDTSRNEIVPFLRNPDLHRRIAFHFDRLHALTRLSSLYLDQVAGIASALGGVEHTRDALKTHLSAVSADLLDKTDRLRAELQGLVPIAQASG